jgi:hypothetical protein
MKSVRVIVTLPAALKAKLDALRKEGYTASGIIRCALERELNRAQAPAMARKGH